jgi:hypothetical protein
MEQVEQRVDALRKELAAIRSQRAMATEIYHQNTREWRARQQNLSERLRSRDAGGTLIYLMFFDKNKSLPSSIVMRQAKLCSYLHNIEVNKFQMKLLTWQSMDITDYFNRQMSRMKEESGVSQITTLNEIAEVQLSISNLEDSFKRLNDTRRSKTMEFELSQELLKSLATSTTIRSPVDTRFENVDRLFGKKQRSHHSLISEFKDDSQNSNTPSIDNQPCRRMGILMKANKSRRTWNVPHKDIITDFASARRARLEAPPVLVNPGAWALLY